MLKLLQLLPKTCSPFTTRALYAGAVDGGLLRHAFRTDDANKDDLPLLDDSISAATALWKKEELLSRLKNLLNCTHEQSEKLYKANRKALRVFAARLLTDNIELLRANGIDDKFIYENPRVLSTPTDDLAKKLKLLRELPAVEDCKMLTPFLKASLKAIDRMVAVAKQETIPGGNRINYLSERTGTEVPVVIKFFATNIRVYRIALDKFIANLDICLAHLEPAHVVRHLSVLAYATSSIRERLQALKNSPLETIKPWMVRVPDIALGKSFEAVIEKGRQPVFKDSVTGTWFETYVLKRMESLLGCTEETSRAIYDKCKGSVHLVDNIEFLLEKGVVAEVIIQHAPMLTAKREDLHQKVATLETLQCLRNLNDVVPLCVLKAYQLKKIVNNLNNEQLGPVNTNRIYYFADSTGFKPGEVTEQFARRTFMFRIPKDSFLANLKLFLEHMNREDILADLWAFKYSPGIVAERIARAKEVRGKKLMPWMVRCPDVVLEKSLQLTKESGALLGENETIVEYFCKRLGFDREVANSIFIKAPSVRNVRITKVKKVIDYLLDELDYTPNDIALNPRILMHSLQTTKKRMAQLKEIGCRPKSLIIVCKSQRQYDLFVKEWIDAKERKTKVQQYG
ncbi:transcription termination factor, mitochondrial [Anopheles arabiensis]|uniref:Mitochondrial transcription termination factor n=2 Tax=gambiae species complex TaxID=44542 RepID=A0A6E8VWB8_ANOCL|nr:transcription termination factor, mitochondrial [Anopheles arabiensis]XP_040236975.2 transcription termination factor, mitochondrial [Anopheles coluzzii]